MLRDINTAIVGMSRYHFTTLGGPASNLHCHTPSTVGFIEMNHHTIYQSIMIATLG